MKLPDGRYIIIRTDLVRDNRVSISRATVESQIISFRFRPERADDLWLPWLDDDGITKEHIGYQFIILPTIKAKP